MKIKQLNTENTGITDHSFPGYQHGDGITKTGLDAHEALTKDFHNMAIDLTTLFPEAKKFLDIGSGAGYLSEKLRTLNPNIIAVTLDGNLETVNLPTVDIDYHFILRTDVDYTLVNEKNEIVKFDIITSFEHFEHIQPETFDVFINNIKKHSHENTVLIASAASWAYNGYLDRVHCNVKTEEYWHRYMLDAGFQPANINFFTAHNTAACALRWKSTTKLVYKISNA